MPKKLKYVPTPSELVPSDEYNTDDSFNESQRQTVTELTRKDRLESYQTTLAILEAKKAKLGPIIDNRTAETISLSKFTKQLEAQVRSNFLRLQKKTEQAHEEEKMSRSQSQRSRSAGGSGSKSRGKKKSRNTEDDQDYTVQGGGESDSHESDFEETRKPKKARRSVVKERFDKYSHKRKDGEADDDRATSTPSVPRKRAAAAVGDYSELDASAINWDDVSAAGTPGKTHKSM